MMKPVNEELLGEVLHSKHRVVGLTHNFYRYPARFSPELARQLISEFSTPNDYVLDPFMGGGTTIVEALASGRRAIGIDINELACFVTRVKTTPLSERDAEELLRWVDSLDVCSSQSSGALEHHLDPRIRNIPDSLRDVFETAIESLQYLRFPRQRRFARCALLKVGQWALDCKSVLPTQEQLCERLRSAIREMLDGLRELVKVAHGAGIHTNKITAYRILIRGSVNDQRLWESVLDNGNSPRLVLTSPPYPGVHVLYHRWQVLGRRETPAPYWLADLRDGHGASYYTMGGRSAFGLQNYFTSLQNGFRNLRSVLSPDTIVVQLVAFSQTDSQLPQYLAALAGAGYEPIYLPSIASPGYHIRTVPNRKWYANLQAEQDASQELLLIHRLRS
jgi:SAM-dependent methyltransferase